MATRRPDEHDAEHEHDDCLDDLDIIPGEATDDAPDVIAGVLRLEVLRADEGEIPELSPT